MKFIMTGGLGDKKGGAVGGDPEQRVGVVHGSGERFGLAQQLDRATLLVIQGAQRIRGASRPRRAPAFYTELEDDPEPAEPEATLEQVPGAAMPVSGALGADGTYTFDIKGAIITIDAIGTQTGIAGKITRRGQFYRAVRRASDSKRAASFEQNRQLISDCEVFGDIEQDVKQATSLAEAVESRSRHFDPLDVALIRVGEDSQGFAAGERVSALPLF